jgi:hypothetical protein
MSLDIYDPGCLLHGLRMHASQHTNSSKSMVPNIAHKLFLAKGGSHDQSSRAM